MVLRRTAIALLLFLGSISPVYATTCDSLVLTGLDASSSVGANGISLEINGMAEALSSPNVHYVVQSGPNKCIGFAVYLWAAGPYKMLVDWTVISSKEDAIMAATKLRNSLPDAMDTVNRSLVGTLTDVSQAIMFGDEIFNNSPIFARRKVLNISGDGVDNSGEEADKARDALKSKNIIINGIVFSDMEVYKYYRKNVMSGPGSFVLFVDNPEQWPGVFISKFRLDVSGEINGLQER